MDKYLHRIWFDSQTGSLLGLVFNSVGLISTKILSAVTSELGISSSHLVCTIRAPIYQLQTLLSMHAVLSLVRLIINANMLYPRIGPATNHAVL